MNKDNQISIWEKQIDNGNYEEKCIALNNIGMHYFNEEEYIKAIWYFKKILEIGTIAEVYENICACYLKLRFYDKALENGFKLLDIKKTEKCLTGIADIYFYQKKYKLSIKYYKKSYKLKKNERALYNLCFPYLASHNLKLGLSLYENRLNFNESENSKPKRVNIPFLDYWDGKKECNNLLVVYEQGFGDNIFYFRYLIELTEKYPNMTIGYFCRNEISKIFKKWKNIKILDTVSQNEYDYKVYIMSLPYILNLEQFTPNKHNYILLDEKKNLEWRKKMSNLKKFKIGLAWKGLLNSFIQKTIDFKELEILTKLDISIICLHRKNDLEDINKYSFKNNIEFFDIDKDVPFEDTKAILSNIDLLVTIDSCLTYFGGIMNLNTILLLGKYTDWRWFDYEHDSVIWFNSVKTIRMEDNNSWTNVLKLCCDKIKFLQENPDYKFCNTKNLAIRNLKVDCKIPISIGELWDKYTILLIKKEKIKNKQKLEQVEKELEELKSQTNVYSIDQQKISELKECNEKLWDIEDNIRIKERNQTFDSEFIDLARSVYKTNDERHKIKNSINSEFNLDFKEVKNYEQY